MVITNKAQEQNHFKMRHTILHIFHKRSLELDILPPNMHNTRLYSITSFGGAGYCAGMFLFRFHRVPIAAIKTHPGYRIGRKCINLHFRVQRETLGLLDRKGQRELKATEATKGHRVQRGHQADRLTGLHFCSSLPQYHHSTLHLVCFF